MSDPPSSLIPNNVDDYTTKEYWDARYEKQDAYDWLATFAELEPVLRRHILPTDTVLHVGCGTSPLGIDVLKAGIAHRVINTDYSEVAIDRMRDPFPRTETLEWAVMDCQALGCSDDSVDVVLDKGAMDAFLPAEVCGEDLNPEVSEMVAEIRRVLKPGGRYMQVSFGAPRQRIRYFAPLRYLDSQPEDALWSLDLDPLDGRFVKCYCWTKLV